MCVFEIIAVPTMFFKRHALILFVPVLRFAISKSIAESYQNGPDAQAQLRNGALFRRLLFSRYSIEQESPGCTPRRVCFSLDPPICLRARGSAGFECDRDEWAGSSVPVSHRSLPQMFPK